jgi:acyl-CoA reductase-like NAD-dependent aldehyde dehydrogenase
VSQAVDAAAAAFHGWSRVPIEERAHLLAQASGVIETCTGQWTDLLTHESGKTLAQSQVDFNGAARTLHYFAGKADALADEVREDRSGRLLLRREPIGVCAAIVPWNMPLIIAMVKIGPALLAGNTVVLKAPELSPLTIVLVATEIAKLLPPGVLNIVTGTGPDVGRTLVRHPRVRKVAFTGGGETGKAVMADAAGHLAHVTLELGGNDAAIVLDDADLTPAWAAEVASGAFFHAGQICFAVKRLLVDRSRYAEAVELLRHAVDALVVGDGVRPDVTLGPVINRERHASVTALIERSAAAGLDVCQLGTYDEGTDVANGYFLRPHLVLDPPRDALVVTCEQFGPILPVLPVSDEDDAIEMANSSELGLASSVWSADVERAFRVAQRIEAGTTFVNGHSIFTLDPDAPSGGVKGSGIGREKGDDGIYEYTERHSITNRRVNRKV